MFFAFLHGFLLSIGLILPLGAQNVFVFSQGMIQPSVIKAFPVIITAALADTLLILFAVGGVSLAVLSFYWLKTALVIIGVVFLTYIGRITWKSGLGGSLQTDGQVHWPIKKQVVFALSVSLLNPHAILDTIGVIGTSSLSYAGTEKLAFGIACVSVSWVWFLFLAIAGRTLGAAGKTESIMTAVNKISAIIMWGCAVYLLLTLV